MGCSEYRDPYTGICPTFEDMEVKEITATSAKIFWRSDHLVLAHVLYRPSNAPERVHRGELLDIEHEVLLEDLFPETSYRVTLLKDISDAEEQVVECGNSETFSFRTHSLAEDAEAPGNPVDDPEDPLAP